MALVGQYGGRQRRLSSVFWLDLNLCHFCNKNYDLILVLGQNFLKFFNNFQTKSTSCSPHVRHFHLKFAIYINFCCIRRDRSKRMLFSLAVLLCLAVVRVRCACNIQNGAKSLRMCWIYKFQKYDLGLVVDLQKQSLNVLPSAWNSLSKKNGKWCS